MQHSIVKHSETGALLLHQLVNQLAQVVHNRSTLLRVGFDDLGEIGSGVIVILENDKLGTVPLAEESVLLCLGRNCAVDVVKNP